MLAIGTITQSKKSYFNFICYIYEITPVRFIYRRYFILFNYKIIREFLYYHSFYVILCAVNFICIYGILLRMFYYEESTKKEKTLNYRLLKGDIK